MESLIRRLRDKESLAKLIGKAPPFLKAIEQVPAVETRTEALDVAIEVVRVEDLI